MKKLIFFLLFLLTIFLLFLDISFLFRYNYNIIDKLPYFPYRYQIQIISGPTEIFIGSYFFKKNIKNASMLLYLILILFGIYISYITFYAILNW